jgi:transcriptional regulator with XRE-family HTH domain
MKQIEKQFGMIVRRLREKQGISQEAFALKAGIHRTYISSIELGKVQVSIGIAEKLSQTLEVKLSQIWKEIEKLKDDQ